jgi:thiosulfate/3-mercaptopyruvate sulfurtransferase
MGQYAHPEMLVETAWLAEHGKDAGIRLVECRHRRLRSEPHPSRNRLELDNAADVADEAELQDVAAPAVKREAEKDCTAKASSVSE